MQTAHDDTKARAEKFPATMILPGTQLAPEAGYELVKNLIFHQVHKFRKRYGGDVEELICEANLSFMKGHLQFVSGKRKRGGEYITPYSTEIRYWVWFGMFGKMRQRLKRQQKAPMVPWEDRDFVDTSVNDFDLDEYIEDFDKPLSRDGRLIIELILDEPDDTVSQIAEGKGGQPRNYRSTVRQVLRKKYYWNTLRINEAFAELKEVMG